MTDNNIRSLERVWMASGILTKELRTTWKRAGRCYFCGGSDCLEFCIFTLTRIAQRLAQSIGISTKEATKNITKMFNNGVFDEITKNIGKIRLPPNA